MTKLVLAPLDIPDRWYEIALSKAAPLVRVLLAKSGGSHVTHKYIMKKPDGKGGWVYYYRKENGELYSSGETPQRNVDQWLATVRGAMSRLRKQMGDNPTPAQTAKMEKLKAEQAKASAAKKAGKTHASSDDHPEDKEETGDRILRLRKEARDRGALPPKRSANPTASDLSPYGSVYSTLTNARAGAQDMMRDKAHDGKFTHIYMVNDHFVVGPTGLGTTLKERFPGATVNFVHEEKPRTEEQQYVDQFEEQDEKDADRVANMKRAANNASDYAEKVSRERDKRGDISSKSFEEERDAHHEARLSWERYAQAHHETNAKREAYDKAAEHKEKAQDAHSTAKVHREIEEEARKDREKPKKEETRSMNERLSEDPKFDTKNGMYKGLPPEAGKVFKHDGRPTIWLASLVDAGDKRKGYGGHLSPVKEVRGDYAVHGSKDSGWSVTHIPSGMSIGKDVGSLAEATDYAAHMDAAGVKIEGPASSVFGMGQHKEKGAAPIQYDMHKLSAAAKAWTEKREAKRTEKAQAPKKARAPRKPKEPNPKQEKQDEEWYDEEKSKELSPKDYAMGLRAHVKRLKNLDPNIASISSGYTGSGGQSHQRQYIVRFKDGTRPLDFFIRDGEVTKGVYGDVIGFSTKGKSFEETIQNLAKRTRAHAIAGKTTPKDIKKAQENIMSKAHDYPAHIRKGFRLDGPDALSKGLYKFAPYNGKSMPKIDDEYLPAYLDAFIEEAYEHECHEKAHGENTMGRVGDMADYWATFVWHELVSYMPSNTNLERACKKLGCDASYVAQRIRDLNLLTPQNDYATVQGDFMGGYMESEIATSGLVRKGGSLYDEVFAASETERSLGAIDRGRLAKSDREHVVLEGGEDPMEAFRKSADVRDAALGSLYGTNDAVVTDPKAGRNWFER